MSDAQESSLSARRTDSGSCLGEHVATSASIRDSLCELTQTPSIQPNECGPTHCYVACSVSAGRSLGLEQPSDRITPANVGSGVSVLSLSSWCEENCGDVAYTSPSLFLDLEVVIIARRRLSWLSIILAAAAIVGVVVRLLLLLAASVRLLLVVGRLVLAVRGSALI